MKPGRATIETLTDNILNFETSRRADKHRSRLSFAGKLGFVLSHGSYADLVRMIVPHRELRRAARRLAKLALAQAEELRQAHVEHDALITRIVKLEAEIDRTSKDEWDDRELRPEEEAAIHAAFPTRSERHDLYAEAMRLVGAKRSKNELVKLVNWLLHRAELPAPENEIAEARGFLWRVLGYEPPTNHVGELARMLKRSRAA